MYVVSGDIVGSRRLVRIATVLDGLQELLDAVNAARSPIVGLHLVVRDQFAGVYATPREAAEAALRLRLHASNLLVQTTDGEDEPLDLRIGIGEGTSYATPAGSFSGSAWFHADDARKAVQAMEGSRKWPPSLRSACRGDDVAFVAVLNSYFVCQDQLLERMDARDRRALRGLLDSERQVDIAADLGVTQPAIARRVRDRGAMAIHRAVENLPATRAQSQVPTMDPEPSASSPSRPDTQQPSRTDTTRTRHG